MLLLGEIPSVRDGGWIHDVDVIDGLAGWRVKGKNRTGRSNKA